MRGPWKTAIATTMALSTVGWSDDLAEERVFRAHVEPLHDEVEIHAPDTIDGRAFPDGVLALTWDDGPDVHTLDLARFLAEQRVSATFFVVGEWDHDVSSDPGIGKAVYATGYRRIPILGDLVRLGHRLGNHTLDHALLADASIEAATDQLAREQIEIDPFVTNELRMFRAPGGQWSRDAASALDDPRLAGMVGPIRWDVDAKDWEGSLYCRSSAPRRECEHGRVRPEVIADRYLARIDRAKHGIVLLHDRVGDVGSRYALDVAKRLVPRLVAGGYVFAAPVLAFSPMKPRSGAVVDTGSLAGDLNGDGRKDACKLTTSGVSCALSTGTRLLAWTTWHDAPLSNAFLTDVNGDARADLCTRTPEGVLCGLAP